MLRANCEFLAYQLQNKRLLQTGCKTNATTQKGILMYAWGDVIKLIYLAFWANETKIGKLLSSSTSTISRIYTGKKVPSFDKDFLFSKIFDPANPDSPASV